MELLKPIFKHYATVNENNYVIGYKSTGVQTEIMNNDILFCESEERHAHYQIQDENGCYLLKRDGDSIVETTDAEKIPQLIPHVRAKLNATAKTALKDGGAYTEGGTTYLLPITDEWVSQWLALGKSISDGTTESMIIDTVDNEQFTLTAENYEAVTDALFAARHKIIITDCQEVKRTLSEFSYSELLEML